MNQTLIQVELVGGPLCGEHKEWEDQSLKAFPYHAGVCRYIREKDEDGTPKGTAIYCNG